MLGEAVVGADVAEDGAHDGDVGAGLRARSGNRGFGSGGSQGGEEEEEGGGEVHG